MNLVTRYIIFELIKVFVVTLVAMTLLMLLVGVVQEAIQQNLTPLTILKLIPFLLPNALFFAIPGTILFSVCSVYARMAAGNEVIAIKSLGLSPMHVVWPALFLSFFLSLVTVVLNDVAVSWGKQGVYRVILHSVEKTIYAMLNAEQRYDNGRLSMSVDRVEGKELYGLTIEKHDPHGKGTFRLNAAQARMTCDPQNDKLLIWIRNGSFEVGDRATIQIDEDVIPIALADAAKKNKGGIRPSSMPIRAMSSELGKADHELRRGQRGLAMTAAFQMLGGNMVGLTDPAWQSRLHATREIETRRHRLETEPWRRWANGFSCLCFVFVGAPLAIRLQKSDFWVVFFMCFMPILLAYYPLLMLGISKAKSGALPPYSVWLANSAMLVAGLYLMRRMLRN